MTTQPEALRLARKFEEVGFVGDHKFAQDHWCRQAAVELRRLHTENQQLHTKNTAFKAEIESLQARVQELGKIARENRSKKVIDLERRIAEMEGQMAAIGAGGVEPLRRRASQGVHADVAIPISPSDAGFPASGSAAPVAHADSRDVERWIGIGKAIERACADLPEATEIIVSLEKDAGTVTLIDQDGNEHENFSTDYGFAGVLNEAIDAAIAAQAKQGE